jgi:RNA polymerase-binding transcription factor DksA
VRTGEVTVRLIIADHRQSATTDVADTQPGTQSLAATESMTRPARVTLQCLSYTDEVIMTVSATTTSRFPNPPPRLRSRGGSGAGSSDQPGRRNPRPKSSLADNWGEFVDEARSTLMAQRTFRIHQLQQLEAAGGHAEGDAARTEVRLTLRSAAHSALRDIQSALRRMQQGSYGRCHRCGHTMPVDLLRALPMARLCGQCVARQTGAPTPSPATLDGVPTSSSRGPTPDARTVRRDAAAPTRTRPDTIGDVERSAPR